MTTGRLMWIHRDTGGDVGASIARANQIASTRAWSAVTDPVEREAHFRAWLVGISATVSALGSSPPRELVQAGELDAIPLGDVPGKKVILEYAQASDPTALDYQTQLAAGVIALATGRTMQPAELGAIPDGHTIVVRTTDGDAAVAGETAVLPVLAVIAIVLVAGAAAAAIAAMVTEATAQSIAVDAKKQELIAAMATSAAVVDTHQAAEAAAGHALPWDAATTETLNTLRGAIKSTVAWEPPPLVSVPNLAGVSNATANAIDNVGKGASFALPIGVAIAAYFYFSERRKAA